MQQAFLDVNGVRTNVLTFGKWVEESFKPSDPKDIILMIPGNPGVTGFYKMFMHTMHEKTGFPVWIVGHAGHEIPKNNTVDPIPPLKGNEDLFRMQGQIKHKIDFINKYVPENAKLHIVGHSIGSYVILNLLKEESIRSRVVDVNLLFPAIETMAETRNGKFMTTYVKPIVWLILFLTWIYSILPTVVSNFFMYVYMKIESVPKMHFRTLTRFIEPSILEKVFDFAFEELDLVKERDNAVIKQNSDKIRILYGRRDGWAPESYYNRLKADIPEVKAEVSDYDHAFVFQQSRQIGSLVSEWISGVA
jgi:pimeloyl-ACP methyl ester carboxylesterase